MVEKAAESTSQAAIDTYMTFIGKDDKKVELQMFSAEVKAADGIEAAEAVDGLEFVEADCSQTKTKESAHKTTTAFISAWAGYFFGVIKAIVTCSWASIPAMPPCYCSKLDKTETTAVLKMSDDSKLDEAVISTLAFTILGIKEFGKAAEKEKGAKDEPKSAIEVTMADFTAQMEALKGKSFDASRVTVVTTTVANNTTVTATFVPTDTEANKESVMLVFTA